MHERHTSSGWFVGAFGTVLTATAVVASIGFAFQGRLAASPAQQTTVPQQRVPPAAASTKPAATAQHASLPVREACSHTDWSDTTQPVVCTDDIRVQTGGPIIVGYAFNSSGIIGGSDSSNRSRAGLFFDLSSLKGAELQRATLTVEIKEKAWCGSRIGISGGSLKVGNVKAPSYVPSGPTQTINVTDLLKPIVANDGRGFGGFVITSDTEALTFDKIKNTCRSTITGARLAVDYLK
jgi:hypothetical protein